MELQELQHQWDAMNQRVNQLEIINKKQILEITNQKYKSRFYTFLFIETAGAVVCFIMAIAILFRLEAMDTLLLKVTAILLVLSLIVMPIFVLKSLYFVKSLKWSSENYKTVFLKFQKSKKRILNLQRLSIPFSVFVFFATIIVINKFVGIDNFIENSGVGSYLYIGVMLVLVIMFSIWGNRKYKASLEATEQLIRDVEHKE